MEYLFDLQLFAEGEGPDTGGAIGDPAAPQDKPDDGAGAYDGPTIEIDTEGLDDDLENPEGEPGEGEGPESADDPDQQQERTSKQPPEVDAAFKRMREAEERAQRIEQDRQTEQQRRDAQIAQRFGHMGIHNEQQYWHAVEQTHQRQNSDWQFKQQLNQMVEQMQNEGYDEGVIAARAEAAQTRYELQQFQQRQDAERKRQEQFAAQQQQQQFIENAKSQVMHEYKNLAKDYPDLLPAGATTFEDLVPKLEPAVIQKMQMGMTLEDAFKLTHLPQVAEREAKKAAAKAQANAAKAAGSGRGGGEPSGGTYGLTADEIALVRQHNAQFPNAKMTYKEFAKRKKG